MRNYAQRIGAMLYILWGLLHILAGVWMLDKLSSEGGRGLLAMIGTAVPRDELPTAVGGVAEGVLGFHSWNMIWLGAFALIVGAFLNWRNSRIGYWSNLGVVGAADLGLIFAHLLPGHMALADGFLGPALWALAALFSTIGILTGERRA
jgi:hypothetical protein